MHCHCCCCCCFNALLLLCTVTVVVQAGGDVDPLQHQICTELDSHKQSNNALQQQVVQQQADISRLEAEIAALQSHFGHMCRSAAVLFEASTSVRSSDLST